MLYNIRKNLNSALGYLWPRFAPDGGKLGGKLSSRMFARLDFWLYFCRRIPTDIIHCDLMQLHDMQLIEGARASLVRRCVP